MRTLLLAAGLGTRLRPLTADTPKCLVMIKGQPLLGIWLDRLTESGFGPFIVNTHYLSEQVVSFIETNGYTERVTTINEDILLGTAGTLIKNLEFFGHEDGLVIHADNYCLEDFERFRKAHYARPAGCLMTMMTFRTDNPSACGIVELDTSGVVIGYHEKETLPPGNLANCAVYIISAELIYLLRTEFSSCIDFSTEILPRIIGRVFTFETQEFFIDVGTAENLDRANLNIRDKLGAIY